MTGPCIQCAHSVLKSEHGADQISCTHQQPGAPAPLTPHEQRNRPADAEANVCGEQAIFWEPKP